MPPPAQIPAIAPDGTPGYVDSAKLQDAVNSGYRPGLTMRSPDGTKGIVAFTDMAQARAGGYKTEGEYSQPIAPPAGPQGGNIGRFLSASGSVLAGAGKGLASALTPTPGLAGLAQSFAPGGQIGYKMLIQPQVDQAQQAIQQAKSATGPGDYVQAAGHGLAAITPGAGPIAATVGQSAGQQIGEGNYAGATGNAATSAALALLLGKLGAKAVDTITAPPSSISPAELQARAIAGAINPQAGVRNYIEAVQKHGGDVTNFANQNNIGIRGSLDYSKTARQAGDQAAAQVHALLDPNAGITSPVSDNYQGTLARTPGQGVGRYATLGDIYSRLVDINKLTSPAFNAKTQMQTMTAAERLGLDTEHAELADKLHQSLSQATGVPPESIAALREKMGKLYTIADGAEAAHNARMGMESNIDQGTRSVPLTATGLAAEKLNQYLRGGPIRIADRSLRKALQQSTLAPTEPIPPPLATPTPIPPSSIRVPVSGGPSTPLSSGLDYTPAPPESNPLIQQIADRNAARSQQTSVNQAQANQEFLRAHQLEQEAQSAADARASRASAARQGRVATANAYEKLQGEAARTVGAQRVRDLLSVRKP